MEYAKNFLCDNHNSIVQHKRKRNAMAAAVCGMKTWTVKILSHEGKLVHPCGVTGELHHAKEYAQEWMKKNGVKGDIVIHEKEQRVTVKLEQ